MPTISRLGFAKALQATLTAALVLAAGCAARPTAEDYAAYEVRLREKGKLRTDTVPAGIHYGIDDLVRNFERVALHHEADATVPGSEDNWRPNALLRWEGPLNYSLFGEAVTQVDRDETARLMQRIAGLTGLEITETETNLNFLILITTPEERDQVSADLAMLSPTLMRTFDFWRRSPEIICVANNLFAEDNKNHIAASLVAIGSETGGLLRRACLHEEIVQSLGLANDHPDVRPSIFNDDGEFALLTEHDENLLRILYDPRLEPGMTAEQARPIVRRIASEILHSRLADGLASGRPELAENHGDTFARPPATQNAAQD